MILAIWMFPQKFFYSQTFPFIKGKLKGIYLLSDMRAVRFFSSKIVEKISQTPEFIWLKRQP
ncbi:hypothetical protein CWI32_13335 [Acinetobacter pseudolwoffii]|uniref:Uncharacterized protein n=1 Tax=Acinetobacter pseudolwoffii TaxID=2053287 RepID=A0A2H9YPA1_9GAMM|nr:hypothetical protein CU478_12220 [Acinetobacter pseudolwoffii]PJI33701.1 hypothetical protein CU318_13505 [Acinetobacter pseudolwoffii]PJO74479.1 hypothetical protein CWI32_13335 [Acinetobacter pseudolwoffii]